MSYLLNFSLGFVRRDKDFLLFLFPTKDWYMGIISQNKQILRRFAVYAGIVLFFIALSYAFVPAVLEGKVLNQSDVSQWQGMSHEVAEWNKNHPDDKAHWTGSMFGGMPTTAISTPKILYLCTRIHILDNNR